MSQYPTNPTHPPLEGLLKHLAIYGEVGIMDAAAHLTDKERDILRSACRAAKKKSKK